MASERAVTSESDLSDMPEAAACWTPEIVAPLSVTVGISLEDRLLHRVVDIASNFRDQPTAPNDFSARQIWPLCHCAYKGCDWEGTSERDLDVHLRAKHHIDAVSFATAGDG